MSVAVKPSAIPAHPDIIRAINVATGGTPPAATAPTAEAPPEAPEAFEDVLGDDYRPPADAAVPPPPQELPPEQPTGEEPPAPPAPAAPVEPVAPPAAPVGQPAPPDIEALFNQAVDYFEKNDYALNEAESKSLISEPDKVLPKLAARMHANILRTVIPQIMQGIPAMVEARIESRMKQARQEQGFFGKYPQLADPKFRTVVVDSLKIAKQMKPQGTPEEIMEEGAQLAAYRLSKTQRPVPPQAPTAPGFRPPGTSGSRPAPVQKEENEFSELAKQNWWD